MSEEHLSRWFAVAVAILAVAGCANNPIATCGTQKSCGPGGQCVDGACADANARDAVDTSADAGESVDMSADAGDTFADAGESVDTSADAGDVSADAGCIPTGAEYCFDGLDNDCNGMTDCMDPACNVIAECVPDATGWQLGTHVASGSPTGTSCPAHYTAQATFLGNGLSAPLTCSGCSCSPSLTCQVSISEMVATVCPGGALVAGQSLVADNNHCDNNGNVANGWNWTTNNVRVGPMIAVTACTGTGTPSPTPPTWTTAYDFCETTQKGGGCSLGFVCVPKLAAPAKHCILQAGTSSCPGNYASEGTEPYYSSLSDTRGCGVTCSGICGKSGGTCGSLFQIHAYLGTGCTGSNDIMGANRDDCGQSSPLQSFKVTLGGDAANPTCTPDYATSGSAMPTTPQTLCCL